MRPIVRSIYSHPDSHLNIFNYILPSLLALKPNVLSPSLKKEQASPSADSIFNLDLFFLREAANGPDPVMNALLTLTVLRIDKEKGRIGKVSGDYLVGSGMCVASLAESSVHSSETSVNAATSQQRVLELERALEWAGCGVDDIRVTLAQLVALSLFVGFPDSVHCRRRSFPIRRNGASRNDWCAAVCSRRTRAIATTSWSPSHSCWSARSSPQRRC